MNYGKITKMEETIDKKVKGTCVEGTDITHRIVKSNGDNLENKYICYDSRNCIYKKELNNVQECYIHEILEN